VVAAVATVVVRVTATKCWDLEMHWKEAQEGRKDERDWKESDMVNVVKRAPTCFWEGARRSVLGLKGTKGCEGDVFTGLRLDD
jgi:hypothetical protein